MCFKDLFEHVAIICTSWLANVICSKSYFFHLAGVIEDSWWLVMYQPLKCVCVVGYWDMFIMLFSLHFLQGRHSEMPSRGKTFSRQIAGVYPWYPMPLFQIRSSIIESKSIITDNQRKGHDWHHGHHHYLRTRELCKLYHVVCICQTFDWEAHYVRPTIWVTNCWINAFLYRQISPTALPHGS